MALWAGTSLNTNETALLVNKVLTAKAIPMVRRKNGLLYAVLGKGEKGKEPLSVKFNRTRSVSGKNVQFNLLSTLKAIGTVADGAAETVLWASSAIATTTFGAVELPLVHYADAEYFPSSELDRYVGDELRTQSWIGEKLDYLMLSWENTFGNAINTSTATPPTRTEVCPWRHQISDGATGGETVYKTYGLDRSDSGNADFRGNLTTNVADLTLPKIRTARLACVVRGGVPSIGLCDSTIYAKIENMVESYTTINYDEEWSKFGGEYVQFAGIKWILESRMASGTIGLIDPDTWEFVQKEGNFRSDGIVKDPSRKATHVLNWEAWMGMFCKKPNSNGLMTDITS